MKKALIQGSGHVLAWTINYITMTIYCLIFLALYTFWGWLATWSFMTMLAIITVTVLIRVYDWSGRDWFMIEKIKRNRFVSRLMIWLDKSHPLILIPVLTVKFNPFILVIVKRVTGSRGLSRLDWRNLILSVISLNTGITILIALGVDVIPKFFR